MSAWEVAGRTHSARREFVSVMVTGVIVFSKSSMVKQILCVVYYIVMLV